MLCFFSFSLSGCDSASENAAQAGAEAQQYFDQRNFYEARKSITEALAARDDDPKLHILKGRIELASGRPTDAFLAYSDALSLEATNPEALQAVSQLGLQTGYLREAERAADTMLSFSPELPEALLTKGLIALVRRKHKEALGFSERILAGRPGDEAGTILKARTLALTGKTDEALELLENFSPNENYTEGVDMTLIELFRETSNLSEMKATFKRLIARRPEDMALKIDYANTLYKSGERGQARALIEEILRSGLTAKRALTMITDLWLEYETDPLDENLLAFLSKEGTLEARIAIARYLLSTGKADDAKTVMQSVSARVSPEATALYARTLNASGQTDEAVEIASRILEDDETNADALLVIIQKSLAEENFSKAINDAQIVIRDNPKLRAGYLSLVGVYAAKNDESGMKRVFADASKQLPQDPILFRAFTQHLLDNGDQIRAVSIARSFARDTPASIKAWRLYLETCEKAGLDRCKLEASSGEKIANTIYAVDLPPGTPPTRGLFGRLK
ncbi:tetratricopeptide repeat protein [Parasphingorhabdus cellanae]|uniref:Tetratricopeptide repeat protein n=1 Tax=Parasphingorhabdus cellanae TaxID=2806553 RepID=A0ABX7T8I1_9SPHN|nr:tetratricopeptide repeat protein [Parasphingorhabdus cellanae]